MIALARPSPARSNHTYTSPRPTSNESTVNPEEIAHFSRLSSLWWDEQGEFGQLHKMNPTRMQFIREKMVRHEHFEPANEQTRV